MKKFFASLWKTKLTTRLLFAVVLLLGLGLAFKGGFSQAKPRPVTTFRYDTGAARQVIVVRASGNLTNDATLEAQEFSGNSWRTVVGPIKAKIGRNGFSENHREGDGTSPQGIFDITEGFGSQKAPTGTRIQYNKTDQNSWWVSDPDSPAYNSPQNGPSDGRWRDDYGERLQDPKFATAYRFAVAIDYNRQYPATPYKGSAIFLHVGSIQPTSGCVGIDEASVIKILRWLDPAKGPKIVMGTDAWLLDPSPAPSVAGTPPVGLSILPAARILDTRNGVGAPARRVGPKSVTTLQITGRAGVPEDASVVVLNVTVDHPDRATFLTVSPGGAGPIPDASNLNVHAGDDRAALVLARIGTDGAVRIANDAGNVDLIADVVGYGSPNVKGGFEARAPSRVLSTRDGVGMADAKSRSPLGPNTLLDLPLSNVPVNATAVVMNITSTGATESTFITAFKGGTDRPNVSTLNVRANQDTANLAIVPLGPGNTVRFYNSAGDSHVIADVFGYLLADRGDRYVAADQPTRIIDTRSGLGDRGQISPDQPIILKLKGIPDNTTSVAVILTGVNASQRNNLKVIPSGQPDSPFSNLNLERGEASANLVVVPLGSPDRQDYIVNSQGVTDVIVDVTGWFVQHA